MSTISERRHRASISSATSIPVPPESHVPVHPNQINTPQNQTQNLLNVNSAFNTRSRRHSQPQLSSSAPSFGSYLNGTASIDHQSSARTSTSSLRRESASIPNSPTLSIEFDGGNHVIIRPNRIIRGKVILDTAERIHVTRIRAKVKYLISRQFVYELLICFLITVSSRRNSHRKNRRRR